MQAAFDSEAKYEEHIRNLLSRHVCKRNNGLVLLDSKKGVDIVILRERPDPAIYFLEVKYYNRRKNHSMVSFGTRYGGGFQPAALRLRPKYLETNLRWVLGTAEHPGYYFLTSAQASQHLSGTKVGEKQNGFRRSVFAKESRLSQTSFLTAVREWLRRPPAFE